MQTKRHGKEERTRDRGRSGMVLAVVMLLLAAMSLLGGFVFVSSRTDVAIAGNYRRSLEALYQADAGVHYVRRRMEEDLRSGALVLGAPQVAVSYSAPAGFTFDAVTNVVRTSNTNAYAFRVTGRAGQARATVEAVVSRRRLLQSGIQGMEILELQPNYDVYSYDSTELLNPTPSDSTGEAVIGSNGEVAIAPNCTLDGMVLLGVGGDGSVASYSGPNGIQVVEFGEAFEADPLGATNGWLATVFDTMSDPANNDNDSTQPAIVNNTINLGPHSTLVMTSGNYYLSSVNMSPNSEWVVDTSDGPVNIYLSGSFYTGPNSKINNTGAPTLFTLYSNASDEIRIQPNSSFRGFVYAPYAPVQVNPNSGAFGAIWAGRILLLPNGDFYVDLALLRELLSNNLEISSWREIRG